jgi:hypothetical protein
MRSLIQRAHISLIFVAPIAILLCGLYFEETAQNIVFQTTFCSFIIVVLQWIFIRLVLRRNGQRKRTVEIYWIAIFSYIPVLLLLLFSASTANEGLRILPAEDADTKFRLWGCATVSMLSLILFIAEYSLSFPWENYLRGKSRSKHLESASIPK